jgi:hypothetical protein
MDDNYDTSKVIPALTGAEAMGARFRARYAARSQTRNVGRDAAGAAINSFMSAQPPPGVADAANPSAAPGIIGTGGPNAANAVEDFVHGFAGRTPTAPATAAPTAPVDKFNAVSNSAVDRMRNGTPPEGGAIVDRSKTLADLARGGSWGQAAETADDPLNKQTRSDLGDLSQKQAAAPVYSAAQTAEGKILTARANAAIEDRAAGQAATAFNVRQAMAARDAPDQGSIAARNTELMAQGAKEGDWRKWLTPSDVSRASGVPASSPAAWGQ